ncbi:MAG TPA: homoserine O-succinyltransferase [Xanthomonadales bacterium]|nr:homoserine O-succinyltransferase [Xanthomonadales bacterium]
MPLVEHLKLPAFNRLREQGHEVLSLDRALHQDIRELHIGLLNMMPDAALEATERQFIRLVGNCNRIAQFYVYPFSLPGLPRGSDAQEYIDQNYCQFETLKKEGLDALIITGANVINPDLSREPFWEPLTQVMDWAEENVSSILCSCLATHAILKYRHGIERQPMPEKKWGVYRHRVSQSHHPLLRDINTRFDVPHSRYNDISREQLESAGLRVLAESEEGGVHMAVSPDGFRVVYFQGHPEYDANSLLKEFKREVLRFANGELETPPVFPERYLGTDAQDSARRFVEQAARAVARGEAVPATLETEVEPLLDNTWGDTAKAVFNNWLGLVYQLTNLDRQLQYMPGTDRDDPLKLRS